MNEINCYNWFGHVTVENITEVCRAIMTFLTIDGEPRYYTFVDVNETQGHCTDVRTSQHLTLGMRGGKYNYLSFSRMNENSRDYSDRTIDLDGPEGADMAHFGVSDTYGTWGFSTSAHDGDDYEQLGKRGCAVVFKDGKLHIEQFNGYGEVLLWVIAPERHKGEPYWDNGTVYKSRYGDDGED